MIALLFLVLTVPATADIPSTTIPPLHRVVEPKHYFSELKRKGSWYMPMKGHAVFCRGPVMTLPFKGHPQKFATFCANGEVFVPLHD